MNFLRNLGQPSGCFPAAVATRRPDEARADATLTHLPVIDHDPLLRTVQVTRYLKPLREGGSLPAIVEADDEFLYVLKFRGAGAFCIEPRVGMCGCKPKKY